MNTQYRMKLSQALIFVLITLCSASGWASTQQTARLEFFESRIRPVMVTQCYRCHSVASGKAKGGLRLDSRIGWQTGGDSGPAIIPGNPDQSLLISAISHNGETSEMPPTSRLSERIVNDFRKWVTDGAVDPREGNAPVDSDDTMDIEAGRTFWAFQPRRTFSGEQSIDEFIRPSAPVAVAEKLVRRLFLDLIGLPPTLTERKKFLHLYHEQSPDEAVETLANELLARNEFGEKWARHWLDVARYADSNGGDFNLTFPQAWRYRNYVIDAFNHDMPYDQFLREQIAGDLLPADTTEQHNRQLIATGYLMVSPKMLTERNKPKMHLDIADEQLDTIGRSIMGLTLGCARCHDHKFDPVPTSDYYAMAGILHSTRTADGILMGNVNVSGWTETDLRLDEPTQTLIADGQARIKKLQQEIERKKAARDVSKNFAGVVVDNTEAERTGPWRKSTHRPNRVGDHYLATDKGKGPYSISWTATLPKPGKYELRVSFGGGAGLATTAPYSVYHAEGETRLIVDQTVKPTIGGLWYPIGQFTFSPSDADQISAKGQMSPVVAKVLLTDRDAGGHVIADAVQFVHLDDLDREAPQRATIGDEIDVLEKQLSALKENTPEIPKAMAATDHTSQRLGDMHIRIRGETKNLGPKVPRGFLQVASTAGQDETTIPSDQSGRRELAEWLTRADHPLTARVMANRIWQQLFGRGIVTTTDNFGRRGTTPSHPELLDYLSEELVGNGWSLKTLIREIVCSRTYQQTARSASEDNPGNVFLRHQNRRPAPAETIRDSILAIAGQLDRQPRDSVVEQLGMYAIATSGKRDASLGQTGQLRQRSIYMPIVRGAVPPSLAVFDLPNPDLVTGTRSATNVPAQALFMMNSPFVGDMAEAVSLRIAEHDLSINEIIRQLYQRILIREADNDDIAMGTDYISKLIDREGKSQQEAVASFVQILFSSAEFRFIE